MRTPIAALLVALLIQASPIAHADDLGSTQSRYAAAQEELINAYLKQTASLGSSAVGVIGNNFADIDQDGEGNQAIINQYGSHNRADINQSKGLHNVAFITQSGDNNFASISQRGSNNLALINQR